MLTKFFALVFIVLAISAKAQFLGQQSLSQSSYVIDQSGSLWAWGDNFYGQLGVGDRLPHNTPTQVPLPAGVSRWVLVSGGASFAIAVGDSDKIYTWGLDDKGQIGNGKAGGLYVNPVRIQNPITVRSWKWVSAGTDHCEALDQDGILYAWGNNSQGQLGVGNTQYLVAPEVVEFPTGVTSWGAVAAGPGYTMMIGQNGLLYGCGTDTLGTFAPWEGPQQAVSDPDTFRAYSPLACLGASFRLESRIVQTNYANEGAAFFDSPDAPEATACVAVGGWHTLLLTMEGYIAASGDNTFGQLGAGLDTTSWAVTVPFPAGVTQFVAIAAGLRHSLAIGNDGWLYAWGDDSLGELGIGGGPKKINPVKVMKVCPPISMTATFGVPANFFAGPYNISVDVKSVNFASTLTNPDAFLLLGGPLVYLDSAPDQKIPSIPPGGNDSAKWDGTVNEEFFDTITPTYFSYIRANGSAPLLIYGTQVPFSPLTPWKICDEANVVDSMTGAPIPGADLVFPGFPAVVIEPNGPPYDSDKMVSDANGVFSLCFNGPIFELDHRRVSSYQFNISKENYRTKRYTLAEPQKEQVTFILGPSVIQGIFALPAPQFLGDSIVKVYYPDSLIGYSISRRTIFRTLDSGDHWSAMYEADEDLHDVKFIDPAIGWAVGDNGEILSTTDTGETWQVTHVGSQNIRALALVDYDTSWAVGDGGTVLKRSGNVWTSLPPLPNGTLSSVHFLDPWDGVIGADGAYYIYDGAAWARHNIGCDIRTVYYASPTNIFLAGTKGSIIDDSAGINVIFDSLYTTHTINSIYFLNDMIGYAAGDSGSSYVTYDGGMSWADMSGFYPAQSTSVNFFSLAGHATLQNAVRNYTGVPGPVTAIVRGRLTVGNQQIPISGAEVDRYYVYPGTSPNLISTVYTNDQGNWVMADIDSFFDYEYSISFTDSSLQKKKVFANIKTQWSEIVTLNYNDYVAPPPQDSTLAGVSPTSQDNLSLDVSASQSIARIVYNIPSDGEAKIVMQDILGRTVRTISDGFSVAGERETDVSLDGLPAGTYFITIQSLAGSLTRKIDVVR